MMASLSLYLILGVLAATTVQALLPTINTTAAHVDDIGKCAEVSYLLAGLTS
jgi:hypothetical protein